MIKGKEILIELGRKKDKWGGLCSEGGLETHFDPPVFGIHALGFSVVWVGCGEGVESWMARCKR